MTVSPKLMQRRRVVPLVACLLCLGACDFYYQPLEVRWTVDGSHDPKVCQVLGIKSWIVEIIALDLHAWTEVRCQDQKWETGDAFYALEASDETMASAELMVDAVDDTLSVRASQVLDVDLEVNRGKLILLDTINFGSVDFGKP